VGQTGTSIHYSVLLLDLAVSHDFVNLLRLNPYAGRVKDCFDLGQCSSAKIQPRFLACLHILKDEREEIELARSLFSVQVSQIHA